MGFRSAALAALALCAMTPCAAAPTGFQFEHHDWEIVCDNTRTCRAAGYQHDDHAQFAVSVLLTRAGGPRQPVTAQLKISDAYGAAEVRPLTLALTIDGRTIGTLDVQTMAAADLPQAHVDALLVALRRDSAIAFSSGELRWELSDRGASAVLLKMDEFQGRLDTPGALIRAGSRDEAQVPPAVPAPIVRRAAVAAPRDDDARLFAGDAFRQTIDRMIECDSCSPDMSGVADAVPTVQRLSDRKLLVSTVCWRAAYNAGYGYWVVDDTPPFAAERVTSQGSEFSNSEITTQFAGRGKGDCWSFETWIWNGQAFVSAARATTGMCRNVAAGGTWHLPLLVSEVVAAE